MIIYCRRPTFAHQHARLIISSGFSHDVLMNKTPFHRGILLGHKLLNILLGHESAYVLYQLSLAFMGVRVQIDDTNMNTFLPNGLLCLADSFCLQLCFQHFIARNKRCDFDSKFTFVCSVLTITPHNFAGNSSYCMY